MDKQELAIRYNIEEDRIQKRADGRFEWVCEHGVGHTIWFPKNSDGVHGCDGCCRELVDINKLITEFTKYKRERFKEMKASMKSFCKLYHIEDNSAVEDAELYKPNEWIVSSEWCIDADKEIEIIRKIEDDEDVEDIEEHAFHLLDQYISIGDAFYEDLHSYWKDLGFEYLCEDYDVTISNDSYYIKSHFVAESLDDYDIQLVK